jgi:hypothetical protein
MTCAGRGPGKETVPEIVPGNETVQGKGIVPGIETGRGTAREIGTGRSIGMAEGPGLNLLHPRARLRSRVNALRLQVCKLCYLN